MIIISIDALIYSIHTTPSSVLAKAHNPAPVMFDLSIRYSMLFN